MAKENKIIQIRCKGAIDLDIDELHPFQGDLKELSKENYNKLRHQILTLGFSEPMSIWKDPITDKWMIINAHQRHRVLTELRNSEGYDIPKIPCSIVYAESELEAKKKVLSLTSQFGEITKDGLFQFASSNNIDLQTIEEFRFPEISMPEFKAEFFDMPLDFEEPDSKNDPKNKEEELKTCPNCGVII